MPLQGQLLQVRPGRKRQSQRHAHPIHHLTRVQVKGAAQEGQRFAPQAEQLGSAAGEVHRQQVAGSNAAVHHGGGHMPPLMGGRKARDAKHRSQAAGLRIPHLEHGHIGFFLVSGAGGCAHGDNLIPADEFPQLLQPLGQLADMDEHALALPQAALAQLHGEQLPTAGHHLPVRCHRGGGGGVAAGIQPHDHLPHACAASFLRRMVPSTPLMKRPLAGSE